MTLIYCSVLCIFNKNFPAQSKKVCSILAYKKGTLVKHLNPHRQGYPFVMHVNHVFMRCQIRPQLV